MNTITDPSNNYCTRNIRENIHVLIWCLAWMATLTLSDKAALYGWWEAEWITILSLIINGLAGLGTVWAFLRMLNKSDELQRKIQLDALAVAFGVGLLGCITYSLMVTWGYIQDEEVSDIFVLLCLSYSAASIFGVVRYR